MRNYSYNHLKRRATLEAPERPLLAFQHLFSAEVRSHTPPFAQDRLVSPTIFRPRCRDRHSNEPDVSSGGLDVPRGASFALLDPFFFFFFFKLRLY
jgi:hypothetical protein